MTLQNNNELLLQHLLQNQFGMFNQQPNPMQPPVQQTPLPINQLRIPQQSAGLPVASLNQGVPSQAPASIAPAPAVIEPEQKGLTKEQQVAILEEKLQELKAQGKSDEYINSVRYKAMRKINPRAPIFDEEGPGLLERGLDYVKENPWDIAGWAASIIGGGAAGVALRYSPRIVLALNRLYKMYERRRAADTLRAEGQSKETFANIDKIKATTRNIDASTKYLETKPITEAGKQELAINKFEHTKDVDLQKLAQGEARLEQGQQGINLKRDMHRLAVDKFRDSIRQRDLKRITEYADETQKALFERGRLTPDRLTTLDKMRNNFEAVTPEEQAAFRKLYEEFVLGKKAKK